MAKLISALKVRGTIDDISCCLQEDGTVVVQAKPGPRPEQVKTGKNFDLTRRNASEFGKVTRDAMLLRHSLGYLKKALRHSRLNSHVNKRMHQVALSDTQSTYGSRHASKGNLSLLEGFDFNHQLNLETALPVNLEHSVDVVTGVLQLQVPACIVRRKKVFPAGATHFKIVSCAAALNFDKRCYSNHIAESELFPLSKQMPGVELRHLFAGKPGDVMHHTVGIVFYKVSEKGAELMKGGAMQMVEVVRITSATVQETSAHTQVTKQRSCATASVMEEMPVVQKVVAKRMTCATCVLSETMVGITVTAAGKEAAYEPMNKEVPGVETPDFTVGMVDAKGILLQGAVATDGWIIKQKQSGKKTRLRNYCKE